MSYKSYYKKGDILLVRIRIISHRIRENMRIQDIADRFNMHRNTVTAIMRLYTSSAPPWFQQKITQGISFKKNDIDACVFLLPKSRKPHSHSRQATQDEESLIKKNFEALSIGAKRMKTLLSRKKLLPSLSLAQIQGIYKRNGFRIKKVRTKNGETRSLYNYQTLGAFEDMHYDTKEIADQKSLPLHVYENLKYNEHIPIYEWNIMDMGSRVRFMTYSRGKSSTFGLTFLIYVLSHLRYCGIQTSMQGGHHVRFHTDGGVEFFSGSEKKQKEWNDGTAP